MRTQIISLIQMLFLKTNYYVFDDKHTIPDYKLYYHIFLLLQKRQANIHSRFRTANQNCKYVNL